MRETLEFRAVIFDMDGLLIDTESMVKRVYQTAAEHCGHTLDDDLFLSLIGRTSRDSGAMLVEALGEGFSLETFRCVGRELWEATLAAEGIPVKPGAFELLDFLDASGVPRAVATSTSRPAALRSLRLTGLAERFEHIVTGDEIERGKPAPDIFLRAAERVGVAPAYCLVLEDSHYGIHAAHAAGMAAIFVPDLVPPTEEIVRLAHSIRASLDEVREALACEAPGGPLRAVRPDVERAGGRRAGRSSPG